MSAILAYRRGLLRCSFYEIGRCQSLKVWDERQVQFPRFFLFICVLGAESGELQVLLKKTFEPMEKKLLFYRVR